ncbi:MAG TPA: aminoglycoside phosphotransferase family protein [Cellulomonas sp.]
MPEDPRADLLDPDTASCLGTLLARWGRPRSLTPVAGGTVATTYRVALPDGGRLVVKTGPRAEERLLTHERDLLRTEAMVYRLAEDRPGLLMPRVLHSDFTRSVLPYDTVVATALTGEPLLDHPALAEATRVEREHRLGTLMADLHTTTGDRFGYPGADTALRGDTWAEALGRIVAAALADGARWGVPLPEAEVWDALERHQSSLDDVTRPVLVHGDLRPGNLFVDPASGELTGVADPGRALFGDPMADLAAAEPCATGAPSIALLSGYAAGGGHLNPSSASGRVRLALCRMTQRLTLRVETALRAYPGDRRAGARMDALLASALAELV